MSLIMPLSRTAIPVTTIGGYLGAGKTTLLNDVLSGAHGLRIAVLVNDFGAISIDEKLIVGCDGEIISLANGCACCSIAGDLAAALDKFAQLDIRPDHILVEASGVADPARITKLAASPGLEPRGTIVLADSETIGARANDKFVGRLIREQLVSADLIVLNKMDLLDRHRIGSVRDWIGRIAPGVRHFETSHGRVPPNILFNLACGDAAPTRFACEAVRNRQADLPFENYCWTTRGRVDLEALRGVIADLPPTIERAKGVIHSARAKAGSFVMQLAGKRWTIEPLSRERAITTTEIVFIAIAGTLDRAALGASLDKCIDHTEVYS
jgi:G3E family GTPase